MMFALLFFVYLNKGLNVSGSRSEIKNIPVKKRWVEKTITYDETPGYNKYQACKTDMPSNKRDSPRTPIPGYIRS